MGEDHAGGLLRGIVTWIGRHPEEESIARLSPSVATWKQGLGLGEDPGKIIPGQGPKDYHLRQLRDPCEAANMLLLSIGWRWLINNAYPHSLTEK